jgi:polyhydroxyalkanoate synthesis regulator phasin
MSPTAELAKLLYNNNENIQWAVQQAQKLEAQLVAGEISKEEHAELMEDIKRDDKITSLSDELAAKIQLEEALNALISLASAI